MRKQEKLSVLLRFTYTEWKNQTPNSSNFSDIRSHTCNKNSPLPIRCCPPMWCWLPGRSTWKNKTEKKQKRDFPGRTVAKTLRSQCRGPRFCLWLGKEIPHTTTKDSTYAATKITVHGCPNYDPAQSRTFIKVNIRSKESRQGGARAVQPHRQVCEENEGFRAASFCSGEGTKEKSRRGIYWSEKRFQSWTWKFV